MRAASLVNLGFVCCALPVVVGIRLALWWLPSRPVLRIVSKFVHRQGRSEEITRTVRTIGWSVRAVSRRVPHASCLTQALSAQILLALWGYRSKLRVGVAKEPTTGSFAAHAWVEVCGAVLVGGRETGRYNVLPDMASRL